MPYQGTQRGRAKASSQSGARDPAPAHIVDSKKKQVTVRFGAKVSVRDIEKYAMMLTVDPEFQSDFSEIVDLRDVEQMDLQADDFLKLADQVDPFSPTAKRAFVVRTSVQSHAARMHKILRTHHTIEIFRSIEEAERWIRG